MKYNLLHIICASVLLLTACSEEDGLQPGADNISPLSVTVTDSGYISETGSRAAENGYTTEFTPGDACGLYIIRNGVAVYDNVKLTAAYGTDGTISWQPESDVTIAGGLSGERYFLYYPYQEDMAGKTEAFATSDNAFFAPLISDWQPAPDQSDYTTGYTASDLMTATGTATKANGKLSLNFAMTHRMALAIIEMPKTVYKFTNTTGGSIPDYTVADEAEITSEAKPSHANDGTYRYIVSPGVGNPVISASFASGMKEFSITPDGITAGNYKTYKIDGAVSVEKSHQLQIGDFLLTDGTLISKNESSITDEQKAKIAAIVFWSPAETSESGRNTPASLYDDKILGIDHPNCKHGLAVSVKTVLSNGSAKMFWQQRDAEYLYKWQDGDQFTHPYKDLFVTIDGSSDNLIMNRIYGYQNTVLIREFNKYCKANGKASEAVIPWEAIVEHGKTNQAPVGSTGWYFPSFKELYMLSFRDVDNVKSANVPATTMNIVNSSMSRIGGDNLVSENYWSSTESGFCAYHIKFNRSGVYMSMKNYAIRILAVCAF